MADYLIEGLPLNIRINIRKLKIGQTWTSPLKGLFVELKKKKEGNMDEKKI